MTTEVQNRSLMADVDIDRIAVRGVLLSRFSVSYYLPELQSRHPRYHSAEAAMKSPFRRLPLRHIIVISS